MSYFTTGYEYRNRGQQSFINMVTHAASDVKAADMPVGSRRFQKIDCDRVEYSRDT